MYKRLVSLLLMAFMAMTAHADEASLRKAIETAYPKLKVQGVTKTPYAGLFEVFLDGQIIYTDEKFSFLIADAKVIDPVSKRNLTDDRLNELNKVDFSTLPLDQAIKVVKGNGSRKLVVFSDPDCPFCKRLEQKELVNITDVTIYTFLFPLEQLHPDAANKSKAIWCSNDRAKAWNDWVMNNQLPKAGTTCDTPIDKIAALGRKLGVTSTPTLVFSDGGRILGAYPAKEIEQALDIAAKNKK
jgi:thiol:disulfide interchange protein DsbC